MPSKFTLLIIGAILPALILGGVLNAHAVVVTDDFSDGTDGAAGTPTNPTPSPPNVSGPIWTRLDAAVESTGQTWDASTGPPEAPLDKAYHLKAPANGNPTAFPELTGLGYVGSHVGPSFTDVRAQADFVDFPNSNFESDSFFGIGVRMSGNNGIPQPPPPDGTGFQVAGYTYQYEPEAGDPFPDDGELVLTMYYGGGFKDLGSQRVHLDSDKNYRLVLEAIGHSLHAQTFEITAGGALVQVAERWRDLDADPATYDDDNNDETPELPLPIYESGFSGIYGLGNISEPDFTIDNFRTETLVAGDYNRNGVVDAADYVLWRDTVGQMGPVGNTTATPILFGDMRANGVSVNGYTQTIDAADYNFWKANFGKAVSGSASGSAVPEPTGALLALLGLVGLSFGHRSGR